MRRFGVLLLCLFAGCGSQSSAPIKVGVLHSLSGTMAESERAVVDSTLLAIEEINAAGGLLGRHLEPVVADGRSDWSTFASEADRLIGVEGVDVVFGCWTSACRKTVRAIFEQQDHLLFYPLQYEGMESSPNIIYTGATPNQQIIPAIYWARKELGDRFYLVGSDYIFPHTANQIIRDSITAFGGAVVGERYIPLGSRQGIDEIVAEIKRNKPSLIVNTINGDTNRIFFNALHAAGIKAQQIPVLSFSIGENELQAMADLDLSGNYAAWSYFQSTDTQENKRFVAAFKARYGVERAVSDPMEAAYVGVKMWATAVSLSGSSEPRIVRKALESVSFAAPEGLVSFDNRTHHLWKPIHVGKINTSRQFEIVHSSEQTIRPVPFPSYRTRNEWQSFQLELYRRWGNRWAAPSEGD